MTLKNLILTLLLFSFSILAKAQNNEIDQLKISIDYHKSNNQKDSALYYCKELTALQGKYPEKAIFFYTVEIKTLLFFKNIARAYELGINTIGKFCNTPDSNCHYCSPLFRIQSDILLQIKDYNSALFYMEQDCKTNDPIRDLKKAGIYLEQNQPKKTIELIEKLESEEFTDSLTVIKLFGIGILERKMNRIDNALIAYNSALALIQQSSLRKDLEPTILGNIGELYLIQENYELAKYYLSKDAEGSLANQNIASYILAKYFLIQTEFKLENYPTVLTSGIELMEKYGTIIDAESQLGLYDILLHTAEKLKKTELTYKLLQDKTAFLEKQQVNDRANYNLLIQNYASHSVKTVQRKMELDKVLLKKEVELIKTEEREAKVRNGIIITGLLLILLIGYLLFLKYRSENKKKTQLKDTRLLLAKKEQELLSFKILEEEKNVKELSLELGYKSDFVTSLTQELRKSPNLTSSECRNLEIFIQTELEIKSVRADLEHTIENSEGRFITNLKLKHPELTNKDIRLAVMIVLNHSNKEIAIKRNISLDSVKVTKNRLKKKLSLTSEIDLITYLKEILHH